MKHWNARGDDLSVNACNEDGESWENVWVTGDHKDVDSANDAAYYPMGSIMVLPGCTAYLFYDRHYEGESHVLRGPEAVYNNHWGVSNGHMSNGPRSFKCRCIQEPINCQPDDGYDVVLVCDNLLGLADAK